MNLVFFIKSRFEIFNKFFSIYKLVSIVLIKEMVLLFVENFFPQWPTLLSATAAGDFRDTLRGIYSTREAKTRAWKVLI
jgi:hypothetical protein